MILIIGVVCCDFEIVKILGEYGNFVCYIFYDFISKVFFILGLLVWCVGFVFYGFLEV